MVNTTYISSEDMINKLQQLSGKTKSKIYKNESNYYDERKNRKQSGTFQSKKILLVKMFKVWKKNS